MNNLSIKWRGQYIHEIAIFERVIDNYISDLLCSDLRKIRTIRYAILGDNRVGLDNKRSIFKSIAKEYHKEWYDSYKGLDKKMIKIIENRNVFAHCTLSLHQEKKGELIFVRYKDQQIFFKYDQNTINELLNDIQDVYKFIFEKWKTFKRS